MTSFAPIYSFTTSVVGPDGTVECLLDATGIHDYQMLPRDAVQLSHAQLFFINGLEIDDEFARKLKAGAGNEGLKLVRVTDAIPAVQLRPIDHEHKPGQDHTNCEHCKHSHGQYDPHVWLGIPEAIQMVSRIRDELKAANPSKAADYDRRAAEYSARLNQILNEGKAAFAGKQEKKIITFHDSLRYFARSMGLEVVSTLQPKAGEDPDAARMKKLIEACQRENVRVICVEPNMMDHKAVQTLLDELRAKGIADAEVVEIDIMEAVPKSALSADFYEHKMRQNIATLAKVLK
jgi:ABC-type Zn uptake system ZnuABC Zn-binding protein ZnuA